MRLKAVEIACGDRRGKQSHKIQEEGLCAIIKSIRLGLLCIRPYCIRPVHGSRYFRACRYTGGRDVVHDG